MVTVLATYLAKSLTSSDGKMFATYERSSGQGAEVILLPVEDQAAVRLGSIHALLLEEAPTPTEIAQAIPFPVPNPVPQAVPGAVPGYAYTIPVAPVSVPQQTPYKVPVPGPMLVPQLVPYMTPEQVEQIPGLVPMKVPVPNPEVPEAIPYIWPEQSHNVPAAWVVPPSNVPPLPYVVPPPIVNPQSTPVLVPGRIAPELVSDPAPSNLPVDVPMRVDQDPDVGYLTAPVKDRPEGAVVDKDTNPGEKDVPSQSKEKM
jgi:hypothetical protein